MDNSADFQVLLSTLANEQTFNLKLLNNNTVKCKQLTTSQLKELVQAVVDSPVTQAVFNTTIAKIFKNSLVEPIDISNLTILDRLLFTLETRIQSLAPTKVIENEGKQIHLDLEQIKNNLYKSIEENLDIFSEKTTIEENVTLTYGLPLLKAEQQLNEEIYKTLEIDVQNIDQLRKIIGDAFINEIAKTIRSVTISDKTFDLSSINFKNRLKLIEKLPAKAVQSVLSYIESYKKIIDKCLTVDEVLITIDGSLFSIR